MASRFAAALLGGFVVLEIRVARAGRRRTSAPASAAPSATASASAWTFPVEELVDDGEIS